MSAPQNARLLTYLEQWGSITTMEAFNALGICRLSERIRELQALDYKFTKLRVQVPCRDGYAVVVRYTLIGSPERQVAPPSATSPLPAAPLFLSRDVVEQPQAVKAVCQ